MPSGAELFCLWNPIQDCVRWATVVACHSSYNKLCYVTVTAGKTLWCVTSEVADPCLKKKKVSAFENSAEKNMKWSELLYNAYDPHEKELRLSQVNLKHCAL